MKAIFPSIHSISAKGYAIILRLDPAVYGELITDIRAVNEYFKKLPVLNLDAAPITNLLDKLTASAQSVICSEKEKAVAELGERR